MGLRRDSTSNGVRVPPSTPYALAVLVAATLNIYGQAWNSSAFGHRFFGALERITCLKSDETALFRLEGGLCPIANLQLSEDVGYVILYCAFGKEERTGDFSIAGALSYKAKYLEFAFGERLNY